MTSGSSVILLITNSDFDVEPHVDDMTKLSELTEQTLLGNLKKRFEEKTIYVRTDDDGNRTDILLSPLAAPVIVIHSITDLFRDHLGRFESLSRVGYLHRGRDLQIRGSSWMESPMVVFTPSPPNVDTFRISFT